MLLSEDALRNLPGTLHLLPYSFTVPPGVFGKSKHPHLPSYLLYLSITETTAVWLPITAPSYLVPGTLSKGAAVCQSSHPSLEHV